MATAADLAGATPVEQLVEEVGRRLRVRGLRARTASEYLEEAIAFDAWFYKTHGLRAQLRDLTVPNADAFILDLEDRAATLGRPWVEPTRGHHAGQLRAFGLHAAAVAGLGGNPLSGLAAPSTRRELADRERDAMSDGEIRAVLGSLDARDPAQLVTLSCIVLGFEAGPRSSEHVALDVTCLRDYVAGGIVLGPVVEVRLPAKTSPPRLLPLGQRASDVLRFATGRRVEGPLFPSRTGEGMSVQGLRRRLTTAGEHVGVELNPQRLRRTAAAAQSQYRASTGHLDAVFGWAPSPGDVRSGSYTRPRPELLIWMHQQYLSPLDMLEVRTGPLDLLP